MPRRVFLFDPPDRLVAGTVGQPGNRTFFLQARKDGQLVTVVLEKIQVAVLAQRLLQLLQELRRHGVDLPSEQPSGADDGPLDEPVIEAFRVGAMTLGWDGEREVIEIEARQIAEEASASADDAAEYADDDPNAPDVLRVRMSAAAAQAFAERAARLVAAGRPPCPLCGEPLDAQGHLCPRRNGFVH